MLKTKHTVKEGFTVPYGCDLLVENGETPLMKCCGTYVTKGTVVVGVSDREAAKKLKIDIAEPTAKKEGPHGR